MSSEWYIVDRVKPHLLVIRENLERIDSRFLTQYTNLFLLIGSHSAILFDTGSGSQPLKPLVDQLVGDRELIVIISHNHFDHLGNNDEFEKVHVHAMDLKKAANIIDLRFLESSESDELGNILENEFKIRPCREIIPLIGDEEFDLGGIRVKVIYTPGHTQGSICLLSSNDELLTGDTFHYGAYYLPPYERYQDLIVSLTELSSTINPITEIYPSHESYPLKGAELQNFENILLTTNFTDDDKKFDEFLDAFVLEVGKLKFVFPEEGYVELVDWY